MDDAHLAQFKKVDKQFQYHMRRNIALLEDVSKELDHYSQQKVGDLKSGAMRINNVLVPINTGMMTMFIDHYPMSYINNVVLVLQHLNRTNSTMARWLLTRTIIEMIYERARVSLVAGTNDKERGVLRQYRGLSVLDFELNLAQSTHSEKYIQQYLDYLGSLKKQTTVFQETDLALFPPTKQLIATDKNGANRTRYLVKLAKPHAMEKPNGYQVVYQTTSRLIHGNPLQTSVSTHLLPQWRERFLIDGLITKACGDLFGVIGNSVDISQALAKKVLNREVAMKDFYETTLKPTWHQASSLELRSNTN